jgi:hypothetical protein
MPLSTSQSQDSLSLERIRNVLQDCYSKSNYPSRCPDFDCLGTARCAQGNLDAEGNLEAGARQRLAVKWCKEYYSIVLEPQNHLFRIDAALSRILPCGLPKLQDEDVFVERAFNLLSRLPPEPVELLDTRMKNSYQSLPQHYLLPGTLSPMWKNLRVVAFMSTSCIRFALGIVMAPGKLAAEGDLGTQPMQLFLDTIMELLETVLELSKETISTTNSQTWFVVRAFLWNTWQRGMMLIDTKTVCPCQSLQHPCFARIAFLKHGCTPKGEMTGGQL